MHNCIYGDHLWFAGSLFLVAFQQIIMYSLSIASSTSAGQCDCKDDPFGDAGASFVRAVKGRRDKMTMQMHLSVVYPQGVYARTRALSIVQKGFEQELEKYGTDYADIGLIHCVDEVGDFEKVMNDGIFDYARKLK